MGFGQRLLQSVGHICYDPAKSHGIFTNCTYVLFVQFRGDFVDRAFLPNYRYSMVVLLYL